MSLVVMVGVLVQAALAGGFLAGHSVLTDVHMAVGGILTLSALTLVAVGLAGRRSSDERTSLLVLRVSVLLSVLTTGLVGLAAEGTARDLLAVHIPLAIISMGLASRLVDTVPHKE